MKKLIILIICSCFLLSCEQISKSISDTFKTNDTVVKKEIENPSPQIPENPQPDIQAIINTVLETHAITIHRQQNANGKNINLLTDSSELQKAEDDLKKLPQYAGKEIFVYSIVYFYDYGTINIMLQHPENPKYIDTYDYKNGKWSEPQPVQLSVKDDIKKRLVPLNKINFTNVATVTAIYNKKAQEIEGAKPLTSAYISIWDNQMHWYPTNINGSRERYSIQFKDDGTLESFKQN
ncbi:hypothetical protein LNQ49_16460 [Flavobacterium sp. F-65]|uniref:Lipoprotein n=1 Tax=Flavobacterium pisciphilum TaxID=2893755 RepID=A0ABS8MZ88_9FLAO|nr:hypothetical protein [Flavobacterium sp. F-65]MCC9073170.1 hypothetical protein [Flavobacterium sp. F-65]